jgi:hypothetical protein
VFGRCTCNVETLRVVEKADAVLDVETNKAERTAHRRNYYDLTLLSLEHLGRSNFDVPHVVHFEQSPDFLGLLVVGCDDAYILLSAARSHPHQRRHVLQNTDSLIAVEPARRVGFAFFLSFNAMPQERHPGCRQTFPMEAAIRDHAIRPSFKDAVVEEHVWHLQKQRMAPVVPYEHSYIARIIAVGIQMHARCALSVHWTREKTLEQRCRKTVLPGRR